MGLVLFYMIVITYVLKLFCNITKSVTDRNADGLPRFNIVKIMFSV